MNSLVYGFVGKILRVDLTKEKVAAEKLNVEEARKYVGGRGLGTKILFSETRALTDPLSPENKLIFMTGPLTGTPIPGNPHYCIITKSPLTYALAEAHASGFFGPFLKFAGFDGIVFEGAACKPVYLWIHEGEAEIKEARCVWGKTTHETEATLKSEIGEMRASVASIGIAGENKVPYASIINDLSRAAGRCGVGAVMGSKKLKAVCVYGRSRINLFDRERYKEMSRRVINRIAESPLGKSLAKYGTSAGILRHNTVGDLPTKNFRMGVFGGAEQISGERMTETILEKTNTCYNCPVRCKRDVAVKSGPYKGEFHSGPEYETLVSFGSLCMNDNLESIAYANHLCNLYGIDTISTGNIIAFAMECYEKGLISKKDTDGIDLTWGNHAAIIKVIKKIAIREGFGDLLSKGVKAAAEYIGRGAEAFAVHVKGLEVPYQDPRGKWGMGLNYAVSNRGASHNESADDRSFTRENILPEIGLTQKLDPVSTKGKAFLIMKTQDLNAILNSLILCFFATNPANGLTTISELVELVNCATGWNMTLDEFMTTGERIYNLGRAFNIRENKTSYDDMLPRRLSEPIIGGPLEGTKLPETELIRMVHEYYALRGWNAQTGVPAREKLEELGLHFTID